MAANRRDSSKAPENADLSGRKPRKRQLTDRVTKSDFGDLKTRPTPAPQPEPSGRKLMLDSVVTEEIDDVLSPFSFSIGAEKPR